MYLTYIISKAKPNTGHHNIATPDCQHQCIVYAMPGTRLRTHNDPPLGFVSSITTKLNNYKIKNEE